MERKGITTLWDLMSALFFGIALALALLPSMGHNVTFWESMGYLAVSFLIWWLLTRRWWLLPLALFLGAGIITACVLLLPKLGFYAYWEGFFAWWQSGCPVQLPYSGNGSLQLVRLLMVILPAGILYLFYRKLFTPWSFLLIPLGSAVLIWWLYISEAENLITVVALLGVSVLTGLARICGRNIVRRLGQEKTVSLSLMQFCAFVLAAAAAGLSVAALPPKDGNWQWKGLVQFVEDVTDIYLNGIGDASGGSSFTLGPAGFMPLGDRLGGDIAPENDIVLQVNTDLPTLLTGSVYNYYDGGNWYDTGTLGRYRYDALFWRSQRNDTFGTRLPLGGRKEAKIFEKMSTRTNITVSTAMRTANLFSAGKMRWVETDKESEEIYFNRQSELYSDEVRLIRRYDFETTVFNRESKEFDYWMMQLEAELRNNRDSDYEKIAEIYLQLPENLPSSVGEKALSITAGIQSPYLQARALEQWLNTNCSYTLTPGDPEEGIDFVAQFLEKREGYCVYYATAMTVMARTLGLPARYAVGYGLKQNPLHFSSYEYVATDATAHAWCEIYFAGIGWVIFDPTGWNAYEEAEQDPPVVKEEEKKPERKPLPSGGTGEPEIVEPEPEPELLPEEENEKWYLAIPAGIAAILLFFWLRLMIRRRGVDRRYYRLMKKYPDYTSRIDRCWTEILLQLRLFGLTPAPDDTLLSFGTKVSAIIPEFMAEAQRMAKLRFAESEPEDEDLKALCVLSKLLEIRLQEDLGRWKYLWKRAVIGR